MDSTSQQAVDYWTIEGMRSQEFSVGIFIFMLIGVAVFLSFIIYFIAKKEDGNGLKTGEKVLFAWIIIGVIVAVGFGATQLLHGRLF